MQPPIYSQNTNFQQEEANQVAGRSTIRTEALDAELAELAAFTAAVVSSLSYIQRDDRELRDRILKLNALSTEVLALMGSAGFTVHNPIGWVTATNYPARDMVKQGTGTYVSVVAHVAGVFATDLAAGRWVLVFDSATQAASAITFTPTGTIAASNAQDAIAEVASESVQKSANLSDVANAGTSRTNLSVPSKAEIQNQTFTYFADGGTADALSITPVPAFGAYASGQRVAVKKIASANATTTPTLNVSALGAKVIFKGGGLPVVVGDMPASGHYEFEYDATYNEAAGGWELLNPAIGTNIIPNTIIAAKGDLIVGTANDTPAILPVGADGAIPSALAAATAGVNWTQAQAIGGLRQFGLTLSNNAGDATNDIDIALGGVPALSNLYFMFLAGALTKQLDAVWALGNNAGMRASGAAIADTTYHIFAIMRPDTGVVDIAADTSASGANIAANTNAAYTQIQRIGSIVRVAGVIKPFIQDKNRFQWLAPVSNVAAGNPGTAAVTRALTIPVGINVIALVIAALTSSTVAGYWFYLSDLATTDVAASSVNTTVGVIGNATGGFAATQAQVRTDTAAQIRSRVSASDAGLTVVIDTLGWIDTGLRM